LGLCALEYDAVQTIVTSRAQWPWLLARRILQVSRSLMPL
jgi:hypothetical protein